MEDEKLLSPKPEMGPFQISPKPEMGPFQISPKPEMGPFQIKSRGLSANYSSTEFQSYGQISNLIADLLLKLQIIWHQIRSETC
jgi:hypothetical protein